MKVAEKDKPRSVGRGSPQKLSLANIESRPAEAVKLYETRRNHALCLKTRNVNEPHYIGITVFEDLPTGAKCWVNIGVREIRTGKRAGQKYLAVAIVPVKPREG